VRRLLLRVVRLGRTKHELPPLFTRRRRVEGGSEPARPGLPHSKGAALPKAAGGAHGHARPTEAGSTTVLQRSTTARAGNGVIEHQGLCVRRVNNQSRRIGPSGRHIAPHANGWIRTFRRSFGLSPVAQERRQTAARIMQRREMPCASD
jgi:hypothetical protein